MRNINCLFLQIHILEQSKFLVGSTAWNEQQKWCLQYSITTRNSCLVNSTILLFLLCVFPDFSEEWLQMHKSETNKPHPPQTKKNIQREKQNKTKKKRRRKTATSFPNLLTLYSPAPSKLAINATSSESENHRAADVSTSVSIAEVSSALGTRTFLH